MIKEITAVADNDRDAFIKVKIDVSVNKDGIFTTTLSKEDAETIKSYGVELEANRAGRSGFFQSETMAGLISQVHNVLKLCVNYKVVSLTPVIRYNFKTTCHYCMNGDEVVPNGNYVSEYRDSSWRSGTVDNRGFTANGCYGVNLFAKPYMKRIVEYGNGKQKTFFDRHEFERDSYMGWLDNFCGMTEYSQKTLYEMEGSEVNAKFFVDILKSICIFNERLKGILESNSLEDLINSQARLEFLGNV